jgi:hypothetical protein
MGYWSDWYEKNAGKESCLVNAEFVLKALDKIPSLNGALPSTAISLPSSANLDTYQTPGYYYTPANATAQTIVNTPWGTGISMNAVSFSMVIVKHAGVTQIIRPYNTGGYEWQRQYYNGTWGSWVRMAISNHTHDDRYYTESEVDTKLNGKADSTHNHNSAYAAASHNHDSVYAKLAGATFTGAISAPSFNGTSSKTAKKNIKPFKKPALGIIKKVDIVSFKYRKDEDPIPQIGFIAEDIDPLLSGKNQDSMRLNSAIGLLLKAVQELNDKIEIFEKEIKEIKRKK